jgi:hypothetical protein
MMILRMHRVTFAYRAERAYDSAPAAMNRSATTSHADLMVSTQLHNIRVLLGQPAW